MYIISYDMAAIVLACISLAIYSARRATLFLSLKILLAILICIVFSSCFSILSSLMLNSHPVNGTVTIQMTILTYTLFQNSLPILFILFALYSIEEGGITLGLKKKLPILLIPWIIILILILSNPATSLIYQINPAHGFSRGTLYYLIYIVNASYALTIPIFLCNTGKRLNIQKKFGIIFIITLYFASIAIRIIHPVLKLETFAMALGSLYIMLSVQNTSQFIDKTSDLYNGETFNRYLRMQFEAGRDIEILSIQVPIFQDIQLMYDLETSTALILDFSNYLKTITEGHIIICILEPHVFALIKKRRTASNDMEKIKQEIDARQENDWTLNNVSLRINLTTTLRLYKPNTMSVEALSYLLCRSVTEEQTGSGDITDIETEQTLRNELATNKISLHYMPIYFVQTSQLSAIEARCEIKKESGRWIEEADVIRVAERKGLAIDLGNLIFRSACSWFVEHQSEEAGFKTLQIKFMKSQCIALNWEETILATLTETGINPKQVYIGITEYSLANTSATLRRPMLKLVEIGVRFYLADYGTGHTSMAEVLSLPFSAIKVSKKVMVQGLQATRGEQIIRATTAVFSRLGLELYTEGADDKISTKKLSSMGFEYVQGKYIAAPIDDHQEDVL